MTLLRFSRGSGLADWIVRASTFADYAHVGFKLNDGLVLDATPSNGVTFREAQDDGTTIYFQPLAPKAHIDRAVEWAKLQIGRPYDWSAIAGFVFRRDWHSDDSKWFCSELIEAAFSNAGWPLLRDSKHFDRITPRDLLLSTRIKSAPDRGATG
jgi:uncharacterized protein YycO